MLDDVDHRPRIISTITIKIIRAGSHQTSYFFFDAYLHELEESKQRFIGHIMTE